MSCLASGRSHQYVLHQIFMWPCVKFVELNVYDKLSLLFPLDGANTVMFGKRTLPSVHLMTKMMLLHCLDILHFLMAMFFLPNLTSVIVVMLLS